MGKSIEDVIKETKHESKKKKETKMKTIKLNQTVKTILTVFITLVAVGSLAGMFLLGMNYQKNQDDTIKREAISLSEQMATSKK